MNFKNKMQQHKVKEKSTFTKMFIFTEVLFHYQQVWYKEKKLNVESLLLMSEAQSYH